MKDYEIPYGDWVTWLNKEANIYAGSDNYSTRLRACAEYLESLRTQLSELQAENASKNEECDAWESACVEAKKDRDKFYRQLTAMQLYAKGLKNSLDAYHECFLILTDGPDDSDVAHAIGRLNKGRELRAELINSTPPDLSAVEELIKDAERYRWLCEDHDNKEVRQKRNQLLEHFAVISYSANSMNIDAAMLAAHKKEGGE